MSSTLGEPNASAIECVVRSVTKIQDEENDGQWVSDTEDWFGRVARPLLANCDGGYVLHRLTGFIARTCARYLTRNKASHRQPPGYFIRALLHSEQGWIWLNAIMDGCEQSWWRELQAARDLSIRFKIEAR